MNTTDTSNNANPAPVEAPDAIREQIEDARALAAILTAPAVLAVLDQFAGKIINRRFWDALTAAAKTVDEGAFFSSPGDATRYGEIAKLHRSKVRRVDGETYAAGYHKAAIYETPGTDREKTKTGARLDAAGVRADFERTAAAQTTTADQLAEQGARFGELVAEARALGEAARAFCEKWRPEFRQLLHGEGDAIFHVSFLRNATRADFRP